jgi:hypothetical protein
MSAINIIKKLYVSGEPIKCDDGFWHVEWLYADGRKRITKFGWNSVFTAIDHINTILSGEIKNKGKTNEQ